MESEGRARIKLLVSLQPGLHLRELQRKIGLSFSSTRYHVDKLTKEGEILTLNHADILHFENPLTFLFCALKRESRRE